VTWSVLVILNAIAEKLRRQSKYDFKGRHFEPWLIVQAERGFEVDHSTII